MKSKHAYIFYALTTGAMEQLLLLSSFMKKEILYITQNSNKLYSHTYKIKRAHLLHEAITYFTRNPIYFIIIDHSGFCIDDLITCIKQLKSIDKRIIIFFSTSYIDPRYAIALYKSGLTDLFLEAPADLLYKIEFGNLAIDSYMQNKSPQEDKHEITNYIKSKNYKNLKLDNEVLKSKSLRLLLLGETGVGKTLLAKWINSYLSDKSNKTRPFAHINCASIAHYRFVDEMFGHIKGAYTGAHSNKIGFVELAKGGDLFLDEIGDLDLECQAELLTYLDNYQYYKLGSTKKEFAKTRIISATNKDLSSLVKRDLFRKDLFSRLSQITLHVPALRQRILDIPDLMRYFISKYSSFNKKYDKKIERIYKKYKWCEGNIRELERACIYMCEQAKFDSTIELKHVDPFYYTCPKNFYFKCEDQDIKRDGIKNIVKNFENSLLEHFSNKSISIRENAKFFKIDHSTLLRKRKQEALTI